MKNKKIIIAAITVTLLLTTGIAVAATQQTWSGTGGYGAQGNGGNGANGSNGGNGTGICTTEQIQDQTAAGIEDSTPGSAAAATASGTLTPAQTEMLVAAIQDEYKARAEYDALIGAFGEARPFTNIINAEANHIDALEQLFEAYGIAVPEDNGAQSAVVPDTLAEALKAGINAEINNIAMYEGFLKQDLPEAVKTVFQSLQAASENHQAAFERRLDAIS